MSHIGCLIDAVYHRRPRQRRTFSAALTGGFLPFFALALDTDVNQPACMRLKPSVAIKFVSALGMRVKYLLGA